MSLIEEQIPLFPATFQQENRDAIDFNNFDIVAVGCGSSVNFSYVKNFQLKPAYSISIGSSYVTAVKFHPNNEWLFIGDSKGNLYIFDYQKRIFISHHFQFEENCGIVQINFLDVGLLVLNKKCTFAYLDYQSKSSNLHQFSYIWKTVLPDKTTNFCLDPFKKSRIFIYGRQTNFFMFYLLDKNKKSLRPLSEQLFLSNNLLFQDAQFSLHIRNYIFFITEINIMLFNTENSVIVTISHFQRASSFLERIIQFPSNDSKIICFHKSGSITVFEVRDPFVLFSIAEIPNLQQGQQLFNYCLSPLRDDYLICTYSPLGITLFDLSKFKMVSMLPFWCEQTSTFALNGSNYALGTSKGCVVYGNFYKPEEKAVFQISQKPITFLSIIPEKHLIYWATDGALGVIDTGFRRVTHFPEHCLSTQKTVGTIAGGFIVQRESCILGLFIDGNEVCIPTSHTINSFCFNDDKSTMLAGSVMLVLECNLILFIDYTKAHGVSKKYMRKSTNFDTSLVSCCAWMGSNIAVGFRDGCITLMKIDSQESNNVYVGETVGIRKLQFCEEGLIALTEGGYVYFVKGNEAVFAANMIRDFFVVSSTLLAVIKFDYSVSFVKINGFEHLANTSKALPIPKNSEYISDFLTNNPVLINTNFLIADEAEEEIIEPNGNNVAFDKIRSMESMSAVSNQLWLGSKMKPGSLNANKIRVKNIPPKPPMHSHGSSKLCPSQNDESSISNGSFQEASEPDNSIQIADESEKGNSENVNSSENSAHSSMISDTDINSPYFRYSYFGATVPQLFDKKSSLGYDERTVPYITKEGRDFWLHLLHQPSLRLMNLCAIGHSRKYESTIANIHSHLEYSPKLLPIMFDAFLYAHRVEEADKLLTKEDPSSSTFMTNSVIATAMIGFDEEISDEQFARVKSAGINLIMSGKYREGGKLLRIANLDSIAASYLIQADHPLEAMRFIRCLESGEEKRNGCFEIALKYIEKSRFYEAMLLFLTSGEFHPALFCLFKLRQFYDAYVIKAFLLKKKLLRELKGQRALCVPNLMPLPKLCQTIDAQFASLLNRNNLDAHKFRLSIKPRTLSTF